MTDYRTAFPDYAAETMPALPDSWIDESWHNDQCPCFVKSLSEGACIRLFIDFADPSVREFPEGTRFGAHLSLASGDCPESINGDDLAEILRWADDVAKRHP